MFATRKLTQDEFNNVREYKIFFISPDSDCWNPKCEAWTVIEDEMLYFKGETRQHDRPKQLEHIKEDEFANVSSLDSIIFSGEDYETRVDEIISSACISNPQDGVTTVQHHIQNLLIADDPIRAHVASIDSNLDGSLLDSALSRRLEFSKLAMSIGSLTMSNEKCELFEADVSELWTSMGVTTAGHPRGMTAEMFSKIWLIDTKMAERKLQVTTQLNQNGENNSLARNLGTNDRMLIYRRIKSHFFTDAFFVTGKSRSTSGFSCMQIFVSDKVFVKVYPMRYAKEFPSALR